MKSPVTCMLIVNDYLWVGSHSGVKVFNAVTRQPIGYCVTQHIITDMILVPHGHHGDEALVITTKSASILIFTILQWISQQFEDMKPMCEIELDYVFCALLVPTINQLWVCTADGQLLVFDAGCYSNHEKYSIPDISNPHCMTTVNEFVLIAAKTKIQKWSYSGQMPNVLNGLDCKKIIMEKVSYIHYDGKPMMDNN